MAIAAAREQQAEQRRKETAIAVTIQGDAEGEDVVVAVGGSERVTRGEVAPVVAQVPVMVLPVMIAASAGVALTRLTRVAAMETAMDRRLTQSMPGNCC